VLAKEAAITLWSIGWGAVFGLIFGRMGLRDVFPVVIAIVAWHWVGVAFLSKPIRTMGERALLTGVAALFVAPTFLFCYGYFGRTLSDQPWPTFVLACCVATIGYWLVTFATFMGWQAVWKKLGTIEYDRRCLSCGNDMNGNPASACPKCGTLVQFDQNVESKEAEPVNVVPFDADSGM